MCVCVCLCALVRVCVCMHADVSEWWLTPRHKAAICSPRGRRNCSGVWSVEAGDVCEQNVYSCLRVRLYAPARVCLPAL